MPLEQNDPRPISLVGIRITQVFSYFIWSFLILVGLVFLYLAVSSYNITNAFLSTSQESQGVVVALLEETGTDGETMYRPVIKFTTQEGRIISWESKVSTNPPSKDVGDQVRMRYDPQSPENARIDSFFGIWWETILAAGLGIIATLVGIVKAARITGFNRVLGGVIEAVTTLLMQVKHQKRDEKSTKDIDTDGPLPPPS